jgi:AraC-like DNA-binding protein
MTSKLPVSTDPLSGPEAFAFWREVICDTFINLDCVSEKSPGFSGSLYSQPFGDFTLSAMESDPIQLSRTKSRISQAREEHCLIVVQGRGRTVAEQDGRQAILDTGDFAIFDSARPYFAELQRGFQHIVLKAPREAIRRNFGPIEAVTGTRISGNRGLGKITSSFLKGMHSELATLDKVAAQRLAQTSLDLVAAALTDVMPSNACSESSSRTALLMRAKAFISENIHCYDLSAEQVAVAVGVSARYLRELFATSGTSPGRFIWDYRIERCKRALCDPSQSHRSISEIAFAWGFNNMSHFSRYFRDHFGMSPREYRETARQR